MAARFGTFFVRTISAQSYRQLAHALLYLDEHEQSNQQIKKEDKGESASLSAPRYTRYLGAWLTERVDDREQTKDLIR